MTISRSRLSQGAEVLAERVAARRRAEDDEALDCDLLIVGSGYGGAVAAARLAGATVDGAADEQGRPRRARVWVLERGQEHLPGSFPSRWGELPGEVRFGRQDGQRARGHLEGLFDIRLGKHVHVLLGNGLGGGSLINAGVMATPLPEVFADHWPPGLSLDEQRLVEGYRRAHEMLAPRLLPEAGEGDPPTPPKLDALRALAPDLLEADPQKRLRCEIAVNFAPDGKLSLAGVELGRCTRCGDCMTGCNQGAKHTLDSNYLAWARRGGAELFCGGWVERIEPAAGHWRVHWRFTAPAKGVPEAPAFVLKAARVILAAGSLGSTAILLRSRSAQLALSGQLGRRFSTNGNQFAAAYRQPKIRSLVVRDEDLDPSQDHLVGPTITGLVRDQAGLLPIAVEEFAVPAALRGVFGEVATTFGTLHAMMRGTLGPHPADVGCDPLAVTPASLEHTLTVGMMGDDGALGRIETAPAQGAAPCDAGVRIVWDHGTGQLATLFDKQTKWLTTKCAAKGVGGTVVPNPIWRVLPADLDDLLGPRHGTAITMHPLGGCAMAASAAQGVVDAAGRVFNPTSDQPHPGLAVLDGAIVPRALGINPALTIAALAERAVPELAAGWGLTTVDQARPADPPLDRGAELGKGWRQAAGAATAVRLSEQMHGRIELAGASCEVELEVPSLRIDDLAAFLRADRHGLEFGDADRDRGDRPPQLRRVGRPGRPARLSCRVTLFEAEPLEGAALRGAQIGAARLLLDRFRTPPAAAAAAAGGSEAGIDAELMKALTNVLPLLATLGRSRTLRYEFKVEDAGNTGLHAGDRLLGAKSLAFAESGNPWRQLMTMALVLHPQDGSAPQRLGELESDLGYFARWRRFLLSVTAQRDQPQALLDLAGFALLSLRVLMLAQWPHFVPPGDMPLAADGRRSGPVAGIDPQHYDLEAGARLSRYRPTQAAANKRPLLLIHGLSAAGSTFTHPAIPGNLVSFMLGRGRECWVLDLRSSSANEPAPGAPRPGPYTFEQVALGDIPPAVRRIVDETGAKQVDVVAHCIGAAMFTLAVLKHETLHQQIGSAVLSQVGPLARLGATNRLRGLLASFLMQFLELDEIDPRAEHERDAQGHWQPVDDAAQATLMVDALLASTPYRSDDMEAARAARLDTLPGQSRDFRRLRHRVDAIVGQAFQLENIADDTLLALDGIFGWVKTRTLAQVLHVAREGVLTDAEGSNQAISGRTIGQRMRFPILLLHGRENQVFDWQGSRDSQEMLGRLFGDEEQQRREDGGDWVWGQGQPRQLRVLHAYGHQDCLIGKAAQFDVFPHIEAFLVEQQCEPRDPPADDPPRYDCVWPWMGPMLGWVRAVPGQDDDVVEASLLVHAGARRAELQCVVLVPLRRDGDRWQPQPDDARGFQIGDDQADQRDELQRWPIALRLRIGEGLSHAYAVLLLHRELHDAGHHLGSHRTGAAPPIDSPLLGGFVLDDQARAAVAAFVGDPRQDNFRDDCTLRLGPAQWSACDRRPVGGLALRGQAALSFALASCQFPPGLFDREVAGDGYWRLLRSLGSDEARPPGLLLLLGDQVYLDAMSNVFASPVATPASVARRAYELGWRLRPLREVVRRLPVYTMLDDHEVEDDWQPDAGGDSPAHQAALEAFVQHQAKLHPDRLGVSASFSYAFAPAGVPFFVLDTRSRRQRRVVGGAAGTALDRAAIVDPADMQALKAWLVEHKQAPIKFVASPSVVLPLQRQRGAAAGIAGPERLALDSWAGYPASLVELLAFIDDSQIDGVVFLSGDAHLSAAVELTLASGRRVHAVVSSGLYAPWPFANARPQDLLLDGAIELVQSQSRITGTMRCGALSTRGGHAQIDVAPGADASTQLTVTLADGSAPGQAPHCSWTFA